MVLGSIREVVDVRLSDLEQVAHADFLPDESFEFLYTRDDTCIHDSSLRNGSASRHSRRSGLRLSMWKGVEGGERSARRWRRGSAQPREEKNPRKNFLDTAHSPSYITVRL